MSPRPRARVPALLAAALPLALTAAGLPGLGGCRGSPLPAAAGARSQRPAAADRPAEALGGPVAGAVPLTLLATSPATAVPVRSGVPFPPGLVASLDHLRLERGDGSGEVPAQFDALSLWPDGSVKAALVQLVADVGPERGYRVVYGRGVTRAPVARPVSVSQEGGATTVDTGAIRLVLDARGLVASLWRDADGDGRYEPREQVLGAGDLFVVNAFDGREYTAGRSASSSVEVEERGPVRAVVRARGALTSATGAVLLKYLVRYSASVGSDKLDVEVTVVDDRPEADVASPGTTLALAARRYGLRFAHLAGGPARYRFGLDGGGVASGTVAGERYLFQDGAFVYEDGVDRGNTFACSGVGAGKRAPGWVALDGGARHAVLMVRDFWQQFPIELAVDGATLTAALFSDRGLRAADTTLPAQRGTRYRRPNTFYFLRPGGAKTHQLRLALGAVEPATAAVAALNDGYQRHRLELVAPPAWYAASGAFGEIDPGGSTTAASGYDAMLLQDVYVPSIERPNPDNLDPTDLGGVATMFGWRDFGDRLRHKPKRVEGGVKIPAFYNDTHVGANQFLHEFVRTGEQRWFALGELATRHFADVDVAHGPRRGYWDRTYRGMGQQPAGEIHALDHANEDHQTRNLHWGHAHVSGLSDLYLLTGDRRARDVLAEIAGWWAFVTPWFFATPFDPRFYREAERDFGWPLHAMNEWVRVTGDATYHRTVNAQLVRYLVEWWRTPMDHVGYDPVTGLVSSTAVVGVNDASRGTGYWTMTHMDNDGTGCRDGGPRPCPNGTNPWMAGPLLSAIIAFEEQDRRFEAAGRGSGIPQAVVEDMLLQCMNYVVKHGWDARRERFVYSEVMRDDGGEDTLIHAPLAWLDRLHRRRAASLSHPEWYDTQPLWSAITARALEAYRTAPVGSRTKTTGFYGYEAVTPVDFFEIMRTTRPPPREAGEGSGQPR